MLSIYPTGELERDKWILQHRPARAAKLDPWRPYAFELEEECAGNREVIPVATVFLTNRECPWRCLMCDLWRNTLTEQVPLGAIPAQIAYALEHLPPAHQIKLYNSGSFFDRRAIPVEDYRAIADKVASFERVIVECHPALIGDGCLRFRDMLKGRLEVAMGLETVHPEILPRLNKRMTLDQFSAAAVWLHKNDIDLRTFVLVKPPFMSEGEVPHWTARSLDFAFDSDVSVVSLIPTRAGNGGMEVLIESGDFAPPRLKMLEESLSYGIGLGRGRVFADLWDVQRQPGCPTCNGRRISRLREMNLKQIVMPPVQCHHCGGSR